MIVWVVLDDRDYYGPHYDDLFVNFQEMADYLSEKYKHKHEFEIHAYNVQHWRGE